jgi:formate dehydrogenase major subunit
MLKNEKGEFEGLDYYSAFVMAAKKAQSIASRYGKDSVGVAISDRLTNEEVYAIRQLADEIGAETFSFNNRASGLKAVTGLDASPNTIDELLSTEVILAFGFIAKKNPVIRLKLKQAAEAGARVVLINPKGKEQANMTWAEKHYVADSLDFMKQIAKSVIDSGAKDVDGLEEFTKSLAGVKVSDEAKAIAELYTKANKAMVVYQQNVLSVEAATLAADIALASGHLGSARNGILQIKAKNNSQGLIDQGISAGAECAKGKKALLIFGEDPVGAGFSLKDAEFVAVIDTHFTKTAQVANLIIPGSGFASIDGTYTNTERRLKIVQEAVIDDADFSNFEIAKEIASIYEVDFGWETTLDISEEMTDILPIYRYSEIDEIYGGVLKPASPKLIAVGEAKLIDELECTDNLMNSIVARLPEQVRLPIDAR